VPKLKNVRGIVGPPDSAKSGRSKVRFRFQHFRYTQVFSSSFFLPSARPPTRPTALRQNHLPKISMKTLIALLLTVMLFSFEAKAQNTAKNDLCVVTFADGKTFYARVLSKSANTVNTKMLHSGSAYSFSDKTVTASKGAYKPGHKCRSIAYYGGRKNDLSYVGDFIEVTFGDGVPFFAQVESVGNDGLATRMLHSGNKYKFSSDGTVLASTGVYPAGHKTKSIMRLSRRN
jgi:hypothetical protein